MALIIVFFILWKTFSDGIWAMQTEVPYCLGAGFFFHLFLIFKNIYILDLKGLSSLRLSVYLCTCALTTIYFCQCHEAAGSFVSLIFLVTILIGRIQQQITSSNNGWWKQEMHREKNWQFNDFHSAQLIA